MKTLNKIMESQFTEDGFYFTNQILNEALHQELDDVLSSDIHPNEKMKVFTKKARKLLDAGHETGLEDGKPKKGSSRAVYFHKEPMKINLDGHDAHVPVVTKIAFKGQLDNYRDADDDTLGQLQNRAEYDHFKMRHFSVIAPPDHWGGVRHHTYNPDGVLAPVLDGHGDGHYLTMGRVSKLNAKDMKEATKAPGFPKGITHDQLYNAVNDEYRKAHGDRYFTDVDESLKEHPLVRSMIDFSLDTGTHPADMHKGNLGIWEHPVTGKKHVVLSDYGYTSDIAKEYKKARDNQFRAKRKY